MLPLDLREGGQIDVIGPSLYQRFGRLDILVHNAGALGRLTPVGAHPAGRLGRVRRGEPDRRLAADPHLRSAAAPAAGRPRGVRDRKPGARAEGLLGRLWARPRPAWSIWC